MSFADFESPYIRLSEQGDVAVAGFKVSRLTDEQNIEELGRDLFSLVDHYRCRKVALDLDGVEFVTSAVLGKMITLHRKLHRNQGRMVLCHLSDRVASVLRTSRLIEYFRTADDVDAALNELTVDN